MLDVRPFNREPATDGVGLNEVNGWRQGGDLGRVSTYKDLSRYNRRFEKQGPVWNGTGSRLGPAVNTINHTTVKEPM